MNNLVKTSKSVNLFNIQTCAVHLAQVAARLLSPPPPPAWAVFKFPSANPLPAENVINKGFTPPWQNTWHICLILPNLSELFGENLRKHLLNTLYS